jgi:predicted transcriptional regulator
VLRRDERQAHDIAAPGNKELEMADETPLNAVELATELTIAWLGNQNTRVAVEDVPAFLRNIHATVAELASGSAGMTETSEDVVRQAEFAPAVSVRKSLASKDHILSMIDGKPYKTLRRHLSTNGLTPEEYRARYNLKADYPMVAPSYSEARRAVAHKIGLGAKGRTAKSETAPAPTSARKRRAKLSTNN